MKQGQRKGQVLQCGQPDVGPQCRRLLDFRDSVYFQGG